ncbi:hypothetical protein [Streptomyces sp. ISL-100]|uniref:hypothetical protein n=1 Tax=Streptomyces sp. ISL-100 TaxID=2819173 RepID=UPI001BE7D6D4|nr:hypothetical protein [Streptomyces sp. ISL-100]MBT2400636.1 hypothetical protein [Streptomyces sp. ISL-100]
MKTSNTSTLVAGLIAFVCSVAAYVVLTARGLETTGLLAFVTPVIGALLVVSRLDSRSDAQDQALTQITRQTNGVLTSRIADVVGKELDKRFGTAPTDNPGLSAYDAGGGR